MKQWTEQTLHWYLEAGKLSEYPRLVLDIIRPQLRPTDRVLDIGSGPGLFALALAPMVAEFWNIDHQPLALACLQNQAQERKLNNIHVLNGRWPELEMTGTMDIVLAAFSSGSVMRDEASIKKMLFLKPRLLFFVAPATAGKSFFRQDVPQKHEQGEAPYKETLRMLERLNLQFTCQLLELDFGQPVADLAEGAKFMASQLELTAAAALAQARRLATPLPQGLYLSNPRHVAVITSKVHEKDCAGIAGISSDAIEIN